MQFMIVYHPGPAGLALNPPLRWQHGPTPGVKVLSGWVSTAGASSLTDQRTFIVVESDTIQGINAYVTYMRPYCDKIEVLPVTDYLPAITAYEARAPEQLPRNPAFTDQQRQQQMEVVKRYMAASTPAEAVAVWRNTSGFGGGKDLLDALKLKQELAASG